MEPSRMKKTTSRAAPAHYYYWYNGADVDGVELYRTIKNSIYTRFRHPIILDLGCGQGFATQYLNAMGFDINAHAIALAKKHYPETVFHKLDITRMDAKKLKLKKADAVVCANVIEHIPDASRQRLLSRVIPGLVKKDGLLIFSLQRQYYLPNYINSFLQRGTWYDPTHIHNWTIDEFKKEIRRYFRIVRCRNVSGYTKLTGLLRFLKSETLVIAQLRKHP